ncbi:MAG: hypothetical protein ABWY58_00855 [Aeromicrobium sp.]
MHITRTIVGVLAVGALAAALDAYVVFHGSSYQDVLYDSAASADDIISVAGAPAGVARAGDGSVLLTFSISDGEGEDEKGAWRLLDAHGKVVRSAKASAYNEPIGFDDGFVLVEGSSETSSTRIALDGSTKAAGKPEPSTPVRAGDILLPDPQAWIFYRPSDGSVHEVPPPGRHTRSGAFESVAIDEDGTIWGVTDRARRTFRLVHSADGGRTWATETRVYSKLGAPDDLIASHGVTFLSFIDASDMEDIFIEGMIVMDGGTPRPFTPDGVSLRRLDHLATDVLPDGRLVLGLDAERGPAGWLVATTPANDTFRPMKVPAKTSDVREAGGALYAWVGDGGDLRQSLDAGATWTEIDIGGR